MRNILRIAVLMLAASQLLVAQGGGRGGRAGAPPARDTTGRPAPDGTVMDFNNQDIQQVLRAIAEAGNLNVTMTGIPALNVTLRVQLKMTQDEARDILKAVAEINGITVTDSPSIIRLVGPPPAPRVPTTTTQLLPQQRVLVVNMIRLKHATASVLAPTLMGLFTGTGGGGGAVNNNGGRGGNVGGAAGAAAGAGGGRGGRGGAAGGGAAGGGAAGGGRGAGGGAQSIFRASRSTRCRRAATCVCCRFR